MLKHILIILIFLSSFTVPCNVNAQMKKKDKTHIWNIGGGVSGGGLGNYSYYGPTFNLNYRATVFKFGKSMNLSFNLDAYLNGSFVDKINETKFGVIPVLATSFNFNALQGAYMEGNSRTFIGFLLGIGMMTIPKIAPPSIATVATPDFGPFVNAGFRIKPGKGSYFTLKVFGGVTLKEETAFGGLGVTFPLRGKERKFGSHACKKHSKKKF